MEEIRHAYKILIEQASGKKPFEKRSQRSEDNIRVYLKEIECEFMDLHHLTHNNVQGRILL
jgi:hypothetical protein